MPEGALLVFCVFSSLYIKKQLYRKNNNLTGAFTKTNSRPCRKFLNCLRPTTYPLRWPWDSSILPTESGRATSNLPCHWQCHPAKKMVASDRQLNILRCALCQIEESNRMAPTRARGARACRRRCWACALGLQRGWCRPTNQGAAAALACRSSARSIKNSRWRTRGRKATTGARQPAPHPHLPSRPLGKLCARLLRSRRERRSSTSSMRVKSS